MRSSYSDNGIVIRSIDSGEADKYVTILTERHGLADFVARGARRLSSKKAPHLDPFNLIRFLVGRGQDLQFLEQAESSNFYPAIKNSISKTRLCLTISEILLGTLPKEVEDREIYLSYKIFLDAVEVADSEKEINRLGHQFGLFLLRHLGYPAPKQSATSSDLSVYFESIMNKKLISPQIK
ncbi:MAG TPA: DNA repair protein RecO [Candidatus Woesebacteria bacterium]|nr:DNA repair protein RecO [Candidatus Woesebacteria bacterium]